MPSIARHGMALFKVMEERGISTYLIEMIKSYFKQREILVGEKENLNMCCEVPQGSIIGPTLWNLYYDSVLTLKIPKQATLIAYADDLAILASGKTAENIQETIKITSAIIKAHLDSKKLTMAPDKTEMVILVGRRKMTTFSTEIEGQKITAAESIKYVGVYFGRNTNMSDHIVKTITKTENIINNLSKILPNVGGPSSKKRKVISGVAYAVLLYAVPIWSEAAERKIYLKKLETLQRQLMIRTCSEYRTATEALQVVSDSLPIDLIIQERCKLHNNDTNKTKLETRSESIKLWQRRWNEPNERATWTKVLIKDIGTWYNRKHGGVEYYLTQVLTGHGCFATYLNRFQVQENDTCQYCGMFDTVEHTVFKCLNWNDMRNQVEQQIGKRLYPENMMPEMLSSAESWNLIAGYIKFILKQKETDERNLQKREKMQG